MDASCRLWYCLQLRRDQAQIQAEQRSGRDVGYQREGKFWNVEGDNALVCVLSRGSTLHYTSKLMLLPFSSAFMLFFFLLSSVIRCIPKCKECANYKPRYGYDRRHTCYQRQEHCQ